VTNFGRPNKGLGGIRGFLLISQGRKGVFGKGKGNPFYLRGVSLNWKGKGLFKEKERHLGLAISNLLGFPKFGGGNLKVWGWTLIEGCGGLF